MRAREIVEANQAATDGEVRALEAAVRAEFPQVSKLHLAAMPNGALHVQGIEVRPEGRGQGAGRGAMRRVQEFAAARGMPVTLSPEPERGRKGDLERFYRNLGFRPNAGRSRDYRYSSMFAPVWIWRPAPRSGGA